MLLFGCGDSASIERAAPDQTAEARDAKRARIAKEIATAQVKRKELIEEFVRELLSTGPLPKTAVIGAANDIGITLEEVTEATEHLGVVTVEGNGGPRWKLSE